MAGVPRFTPRAGSGSPGRLRRQLDGQIDSGQRLNPTMEVDKDGRIGAKLARDSGLEMTREGLKVSATVRGEMNRAQMDQIADVDDAPTTAELAAKMNELLSELRRTKRLRGV